MISQKLSTSSSSDKPKLLDQVRDVIRLKHYSLRTEKTYADWIKRFILFHGKRHPREMAEPEVSAFLTHLAVEENVAASTQNQALSALLFLYKEVLKQEIGWIQDVERAKRTRHVPVVLTKAEVAALLGKMTGTPRLMASLLYGGRLRLMEYMRLRVKDVDFGYRQITVREGKGAKDRVTMLPASAVAPLQRHLERRRAQHEEDLAAGVGTVFLPAALERKYPAAEREWPWQYVFASSRLSEDPRRPGRRQRHHMGENLLQSAVKEAVQAAGMPSGRPAIRCATALPRICWRRATISAPCRSCWGTRMYPRR